MANRSNGYWWECVRCGDTANFNQVTRSQSMAAFIRDELLPSGYRQELLRRRCPNCKRRSMHVAYAFPRKTRPVILILRTLVGITPVEGDDYLPMMWESSPGPRSRERWIHFNYIRGRNPFGLNKAAVFGRDSLVEVMTRFQTAEHRSR